MNSDQGLLFGKTSQEFSQRTTTLSAASWQGLSVLMTPSIRQQDGAVRVWLMDPSDQRRGVSWMPNISDWPNDASVCSLSSILEKGPIPQKYFLSGKACAGILRRAERRGKQLPELLARALRAVVDSEQTLTLGGIQPHQLSRAADGECREPERAGDKTRSSQCFGGNDTRGGREVATAVNAHPSQRYDFESETFCVTHSLKADGFDASEDGTGRGTPLVPVEVTGPLTSSDGGFDIDEAAAGFAIAFSCKDHGADAGNVAPTLRAMEHDGSHANAGGQVAVALNLRGREGGSQFEVAEVASVRSASGGSSRSYVQDLGVRRLTPQECEKLQGFPESWTAIERKGKEAADGPRYRALGNSMAVPVVAWIGRRIRDTPQTSPEVPPALAGGNA